LLTDAMLPAVLLMLGMGTGEPDDPENKKEEIPGDARDPNEESNRDLLDFVRLALRPQMESLGSKTTPSPALSGPQRIKKMKWLESKVAAVKKQVLASSELEIKRDRIRIDRRFENV